MYSNRKDEAHTARGDPCEAGDDESQLSQDMPTSFEGLESSEVSEEHHARVPFTESHTSLDQFTVDITRSLKRTFPTSPKRYDNAHVLLLRWADDDLGAEGEIEDLDKVFRETYHYTTERRTIPTENSHDELEHIIRCFRDSHDSLNSLLIVYYGGHGMMASQNKSIWAAKESGGPTVDWSEIQPILLRSEADVLLLLDCCYASSDWTTGASHGVKEVLAAYSTEDVTPGVHDNSFTRSLVAELRHGAKDDLTSWELAARLVAQSGRNELSCIPGYYPLQGAARDRIELSPLRSGSGRRAEHDPYGSQEDVGSALATPSLSGSASTPSTEDEVTSFENCIVLSIDLRDWTIPPSEEEWSQWLRSGAPGNIESVNARFQPSTRPRGIDGTTEAENPSVPTLEDPGRQHRR